MLWQFQGKAAKVDPLLPDILVFPPRADLHDHPLVTNGSLILQVMTQRDATSQCCTHVKLFAGNTIACTMHGADRGSNVHASVCLR